MVNEMTDIGIIKFQMKTPTLYLKNKGNKNANFIQLGRKKPFKKNDWVRR